MIPFIYNSRKCRLTNHVNDAMMLWDGGMGRWDGRKQFIKWHKETSGSDRYVHYLDFGDGLTGIDILLSSHYIHKTCQIPYFKPVQFVLYQLYLKQQ